MYAPRPEEMMNAYVTHVTISVIERPALSYTEHHEREKAAEEAGGKVPFGFARALMEDS